VYVCRCELHVCTYSCVGVNWVWSPQGEVCVYVYMCESESCVYVSVCGCELHVYVYVCERELGLVRKERCVRVCVCV